MTKLDFLIIKNSSRPRVQYFNEFSGGWVGLGGGLGDKIYYVSKWKTVLNCNLLSD